MEHLILKVLSFDVAIPTINCFCEKFAKEGNCDDKTLSLAMVRTSCIFLREGGVCGWLLDGMLLALSDADLLVIIII